MAKDYRKRAPVKKKKSTSSKPFVWVGVAFLAGYLGTFTFSSVKKMGVSNKPANLAEQVTIASEKAQAEKKVDAEKPKAKFEFYTLLTTENTPQKDEVVKSGKEAPKEIPSTIEEMAKVQKVNAGSAPQTLLEDDDLGKASTNSNTTITANEKSSSANKGLSSTNAIDPTVAVKNQKATPSSGNKISSQKSQPTVATTSPPVVTPTANPTNNKLAPQSSPENASKLKDVFLLQVAAFKTKPEAERMQASLVLKGFNAKITTVVQQNINWHRVVIGPFANRDLAQKTQATIARSEHLVGMVRKVDG